MSDVVGRAPGLVAPPGGPRHGGVEQPHDRTKNASRRLNRAAALGKLVEGWPCKDCGRTYPWYVMNLRPASGAEAYSLKRLVKRKAGDWTMKRAIQAADLLCLNCRAEREQRQRDQGDEGVSARA